MAAFIRNLMKEDNKRYRHCDKIKFEWYALYNIDSCLTQHMVLDSILEYICKKEKENIVGKDYNLNA